MSSTTNMQAFRALMGEWPDNWISGVLCDVAELDRLQEG
jgi:hypothetical protein